MKRNPLVDALLVVALIVLVAVCFFIGKQAGDGEFAGTDATVTESIEEEGHEPWFQPFFEPGSAELESGLFAVQASLGGAVLGYCIGALHGRRRRETAAPTEVPSTPAPSGRTD